MSDRTVAGPNFVELLSLSLLQERSLMARLNALLAALSLEIGWHYPLDIVWIAKRLEESGVSSGATVLDAGAGGGALQFLLADMGYNVLSVDFAPRRLPRRGRVVFSMRLGEQFGTADDGYLTHLASVSSRKGSWLMGRFLGRVRSMVPFLAYAAKTRLGGGRGRITYVRADLSDLRGLASESVDAVVSVSAIEHMSQASMRRAVDELMRVTRGGGCLCVTTSAAEKTWFHEPSQGWCLSEHDLRELFEIDGDALRWGDFKEQLNAMRADTYLPGRLPRYYFETEACGMPWGRWEPKYLPVGVFLRKGAAASK